MAVDPKADLTSEIIHGEGVLSDEKVPKQESERPAILDEFSKDEEKRILRRIDWRILPILGAIYCISLIDRTNCKFWNCLEKAKQWIY